MGATEPWLATVLPVLNEKNTSNRAFNPSSTNLFQPTSIRFSSSMEVPRMQQRRLFRRFAKDSIQSNIHRFIYSKTGRFVPHARNLALQHLPESITHLLEFNGHIEIGRDHLVQMIQAWSALNPNMSGLQDLAVVLWEMIRQRIRLNQSSMQH